MWDELDLSSGRRLSRNVRLSVGQYTNSMNCFGPADVTNRNPAVPEKGGGGGRFQLKVALTDSCTAVRHTDFDAV